MSSELSVDSFTSACGVSITETKKFLVKWLMVYNKIFGLIVSTFSCGRSGVSNYVN